MADLVAVLSLLDEVGDDGFLPLFWRWPCAGLNSILPIHQLAIWVAGGSNINFGLYSVTSCLLAFGNEFSA